MTKILVLVNWTLSWLLSSVHLQGLRSRAAHEAWQDGLHSAETRYFYNLCTLYGQACCLRKSVAVIAPYTKDAWNTAGLCCMGSGHICANSAKRIFCLLILCSALQTEAGSTNIRVGSTIFGKRDYTGSKPTDANEQMTEQAEKSMQH